MRRTNEEPAAKARNRHDGLFHALEAQLLVEAQVSLLLRSERALQSLPVHTLEETTHELRADSAGLWVACRAKACQTGAGPKCPARLEVRKILPEERFVGELVTLRLVTLDDCTQRYVEWLEDPDVRRFLETRWTTQTLSSVREFVAALIASPDSYLFAILENRSQRHIGNIKIGPIHPRHEYADVSYFLGERAMWGRGLATDAIRTATRIGFDRLNLHRMQAGLYATNVGSGRALEKAGYVFEGRSRMQLQRGPEAPDVWEDHLWYGLLRSDWRG